MGAGPPPEPYTIEHGSQVVSLLLAAVVNAAHYRPDRAPEPTGRIAVASGPANSLAEECAAGFRDVFEAWDDLFGRGLRLPWRVPTTAQ